MGKDTLIVMCWALGFFCLFILSPILGLQRAIGVGLIFGIFVENTNYYYVSKYWDQAVIEVQNLRKDLASDSGGYKFDFIYYVGANQFKGYYTYPRKIDTELEHNVYFNQKKHIDYILTQDRGFEGLFILVLGFLAFFEVFS